ncbi:hypothetical protein [Nannocystis pusilla]|uniref:hypothetical protein n=1 Tax=Nannocystis pusilla TaxID=889268 RepID=UPI003DA48A34
MQPCGQRQRADQRHLQRRERARAAEPERPPRAVRRPERGLAGQADEGAEHRAEQQLEAGRQ